MLTRDSISGGFTKAAPDRVAFSFLWNYIFHLAGILVGKKTGRPETECASEGAVRMIWGKIRAKSGKSRFYNFYSKLTSGIGE